MKNLPQHVSLLLLCGGCGTRVPADSESSVESGSSSSESESESETGEPFDPGPWLGEWSNISEEFPIGQTFLGGTVVGLGRLELLADGTGTFRVDQCYVPPEDPPRSFLWEVHGDEPRLDIFRSDAADFPFGLTTADATEVWIELGEDPCEPTPIFATTPDEAEKSVMILDLHAAICIEACEEEDGFNMLSDCTVNPTCE